MGNKPSQGVPTKLDNRAGSHKVRQLTNDGLASPFRRGLVAINETGSSEISQVYEGLHSRAIGQGGTSEVRVVTHRQTGRKYACKSIKLLRIPKHKKMQLMREIDIIRALDHPNIVKVIEIFKQIDYLHIVMELCSGGELFDRLANMPACRMPEKTVQPLVVKMLRALHYLHEHGIIHRDLKLENYIFVSTKKTSDIKLIDFGYSRSYLEGEKMTSLVGTSFYIAPEVVEGEYTKAADLWSFGTIVYMLITGELPIAGDSDAQILGNVARLMDHPKRFGAIANLVAGVVISVECVDFINRLMEVDTKRRLTTADALNHPWIKGNKMKSVGADDRSGKGIAKKTTYSSSPEAQAVAKKVTHFKDYPDIKRAALMATAFYLDHEKIELLQANFTAMDKDGNGVLSYAEFSAALGNHLGDEELMEIFKKIDQDHTNKIKYSEFIAACVEERVFKEEEELMLAFRALDLDGDGMITKAELRQQLGGAFDDSQLDRIIAEADFSHDGEISKEEFIRAMKGERVEDTPA